ncbi:MAG: NAD(P)/FAD-dependent oxidoreductase [Lachnospiraceae bacterium]|nr:NAD(P)/FAD-dependent oxidoreductase [Lachnospiraceae bacterium]
MSKVVIVGGSAAGMLAAIVCAENGHDVTLYERNEKLGKKLFITGKGRCNITNACDIEELFQNVVGNPRFLYSAFYGFSNFDMMDFLEKRGLPLKTERGSRVFPASDKSSDVLQTLQREIRRLGVEVHLNTPVKEILKENDHVSGVLLANGEKVSADAVLLATGGMSYPSTGSTGDGYRFAGKLGHTVTALAPGLVPFEIAESYAKEMMGLSLKNISIRITNQKGKELYSDFGEMLFTHFGVSGPVIISASSHVTKDLLKENLILSIDLKAALTREQLNARLLREFEENKNKQLKNVMGSLLPSKMVPVMLAYMQLDSEKKINEISKEERMHMIECLKAFKLTITGFRDYNEAIITRGGISVKEVNPSTMESKLVKGLYFAGEVLDLDAHTGGYNLQIAWSTAHLAAESIQ